MLCFDDSITEDSHMKPALMMEWHFYSLNFKL